MSLPINVYPEFDHADRIIVILHVRDVKLSWDTILLDRNHVKLVLGLITTPTIICLGFLPRTLTNE
jgi:hypothetical protein